MLIAQMFNHEHTRLHSVFRLDKSNIIYAIMPSERFKKNVFNAAFDVVCYSVPT